MANIDCTEISSEGFENLCFSLLYRKGYRNIIPLGSRDVKEEGEDAIELLFPGKSKDSKGIVFQFKRWTNTIYDGVEISRTIESV